MGPRILLYNIHSDFSVDSGVWTGYRQNIVDIYPSGDLGARQDFDDHLIREYNRKVYTFNLGTGIMFSPYEAGFRFTGTGVSSLAPSEPIPSSGFVFVFAGGEQVLLNGGDPIEVPEEYANA